MESRFKRLTETKVTSDLPVAIHLAELLAANSSLLAPCRQQLSRCLAGGERELNVQHCIFQYFAQLASLDHRLNLSAFHRLYCSSDLGETSQKMKVGFRE